MKIYSVLVPDMADEVGVQVQEDGTALNLYADGTAGVPEDVRKGAEELFDPESDPVISEGGQPSYNPGKPGRTWDDQFTPDANAARFWADVDSTTSLVVEFDEGWHLWQITKLDGEARGHHHLDGPLEWFPDIQDKAVEALDRLADEKAESGATVHQTFNIGDDDEADTLVMYGVPRHILDNPAALRAYILDMHAKQHRALTALAKLYPFAARWADELRGLSQQAESQSQDGRYHGLMREEAAKNANAYKTWLRRFEAAKAAMADLGVPTREDE